MQGLGLLRTSSWLNRLGLCKWKLCLLPFGKSNFHFVALCIASWYIWCIPPLALAFLSTLYARTGKNAAGCIGCLVLYCRRVLPTVDIADHYQPAPLCSVYPRKEGGSLRLGLDEAKKLTVIGVWSLSGVSIGVGIAGRVHVNCCCLLGRGIGRMPWLVCGPGRTINGCCDVIGS